MPCIFRQKIAAECGRFICPLRSLSSLEKRMESLEKTPLYISEVDPDVFVLDWPTDNEIGILEEFRALFKGGYSVDQIQEKIGIESYNLVLEVGQKIARREQILPLHMRH